jgi:alpha-amylase/alpha-mannosidase (GH57 family)
MNRYICIHGHFYQPPRENPWLEAVEVQDSAYPFHDWNKRISVECYAPNAASRILDGDNRIIDIVSNYSRISFNFGPTLLSWMEVNDPVTYNSILVSDKDSIKRFSGHGSAIAQCYNHVIMPLALSEEKRMQVIWGIRDFEYRFKRKPEGMWLPETAVDLETLDIMAENGILFTILAPSQAGRVKRTGEKQWHKVRGGKFNISVPYWCRLPSGRRIAVFFFNRNISHDIAFGNLLDNGINFAERLNSAFHSSEEPQLVHIATDGETYGHHHRYGEMALSYAIYHIDNNDYADITIYGEFLEKYPPEHEVQIHENTSWSCVHGVERWRSDCGCKTNSGSGWNQKWRAPLRGVMDWLRDNLARLYREEMSRFLSDPRSALELYIDVILNRNDVSLENFFSGVTDKPLPIEHKVKMMKLLEMERNSMLMYTSCGWFFDEISGIESVQVILYAARAMQLAREISGLQLEDTFVKLIKAAQSNYFGFTDGADIYNKLVKPVMIDNVRFGAHYAVSSLFRDYSDTDEVYCFSVNRIKYERIGSGKQKLALGLIHITSHVTLEEEDVSFAVLHMGEHNIFGGVRKFLDDVHFDEMWSDISQKFRANDVPGTFRRIEKHFTTVNYSLWHLFRDEQRTVINQVINTAVTDLERNLRQINENNYPVVQVMKKMGVPLPGVFSSIMEFILNDDLKKNLLSENPDITEMGRIIGQMRENGFEPDNVSISYSFTQRLNDYMERFVSHPEDIEILQKIIDLLDALHPLSLKFERWRMQNMYFIIGITFYPVMHLKLNEGIPDAVKWVELFKRLGDHIKVSVVL